MGDPIRAKKRRGNNCDGRRECQQSEARRLPEKQQARECQERGGRKLVRGGEGCRQPRQEKVPPPTFAVECDSHKQINCRRRTNGRNHVVIEHNRKRVEKSRKRSGSNNENSAPIGRTKAFGKLRN